MNEENPNRKQFLIDCIVKHPLEFTDAAFEELVRKETNLTFADLRQLLIRIFDINESTLKLQSDATRGMLGLMNRWSTRFRQKRYYKTIRNGFRDPGNSRNKVIVAEGDSWFQFPFFVQDIIDWLNDRPDYAIYSIAYGGDWFTNILYEEKYIEELSIHVPDVFLISGGGNDFVGYNRLAIMVNPNCDSKLRDPEQLEKMFCIGADERTKAAILDGYRSVSPVFYSFIWTIKAQYYMLFRNLQESGKFDHMRIITQGYDYALPTYNYRWRKWYQLQPLLNRMLGSGNWLKRPLMIRGVTDPITSDNIIKALIFELNYMFHELAQRFPNVYHIDCRGVAPSFDDWFDELHLTSEKYQRIADAYKRCIDGNPPPAKVIRVVDWF
ncbi:hypothetical protein [Botryobacter ruber]|uniref:hypothetical protein n=1 Tax=Botryobacter ruber TaxID=2171629 RepID=UPI000E0B9C16|nr:hypothetical protein [Botryobacter ruber]